MTGLLRLRLAMGFLTRIPVGDVLASDEDFARSLGFFALVGGVIGVFLSTVAWGLAPHLPPGAIAGIVLTLSAALTAGLHLDGLADVFDGLGGGRGDPARMLEVMRDSRIGSHGAVALILYFLCKLAVLAPLIEAGSFAAIALMPLIARGLLVPIIVTVPYVRKRGLGTSFQTHAGALEVFLALGVVLLALYIAGPGPAVIATLWAAAAVIVFSGLVVSKLRGLTGDAYGALIEIAELTFATALLWQ